MKQQTTKGCMEYLSFLGPRIAFLIDWNRREKLKFCQKYKLYRNPQRAPDKNYGHRASLKLGGEQLLYGAIRQIGDPSIHYGQQLDAVLGKQQQ
jgi:hypothetical protein